MFNPSLVVYMRDFYAYYATETNLIVGNRVINLTMLASGHLATFYLNQFRYEVVSRACQDLITWELLDIMKENNPKKW